MRLELIIITKRTDADILRRGKFVPKLKNIGENSAELGVVEKGNQAI